MITKDYQIVVICSFTVDTKNFIFFNPFTTNIFFCFKRMHEIGSQGGVNELQF